MRCCWTGSLGQLAIALLIGIRASLEVEMLEKWLVTRAFAEEISSSFGRLCGIGVLKQCQKYAGTQSMLVVKRGML